MKPWMLEYLNCPSCKGALKNEVSRENEYGIEEGYLLCKDCSRSYPIVRNIPRFVPPEFYDQGVRDMKTMDSSLGSKTFQGLRKTAEYFGFEWETFGRFGWDDPIFNLEREKIVFENKSLMKEKEFSGSLVLDAGCGNGRYSYWAAAMGAEVIGIDIGRGVESAFRNTRHLRNIHICQADIFNPPFRENKFDLIFSIGVLMHTCDARSAFRSLIRYLKVGGFITIHMYHKGNIIYEISDRLLRTFSTKLSPQVLYKISVRIHPFLRVLEKAGILRILNAFIRLPSSHPHIIFDWYSAPFASHHTYAEIFEWCNEFGVKIEKTNERNISLLRKIIHPIMALTVKSKKVSCIS